MHIYYFENNNDDELQTTSISINENGDCIEHVCNGENNFLVDCYQKMADAIDIRIRLADNTEIHFDDTQQQ